MNDLLAIPRISKTKLAKIKPYVSVKRPRSKVKTLPAALICCDGFTLVGAEASARHEAQHDTCDQE